MILSHVTMSHVTIYDIFPSHSSLWSIRNYIHVMLCVSLSMAQLVFIIGVDKIKNEVRNITSHV